MRKIFVILIAIMAALSVSAQNKRQQIRPDWLLEKPTAGNDTYEYVIEHGEGLTENAALEVAIQRVHEYYTRRLGQTIQSGQEGVTLQNESYNIPFKKVCEYTEKQSDDTYLVFVLCQVALRGNITPRFEDYNLCNSISKFRNYMKKKNTAAMVASVFIPGSGMMVKRHYGSGVVTMLGEMAFVGGTVTTYYLAQNQLAIMRSNDVTLNDFNKAKKNYDIYRKVNIACLSAAGVLYVYNLIRTGTMKQKVKLPGLSFAPTVMPMENCLASGVNVTLKF